MSIARAAAQRTALLCRTLRRASSTPTPAPAAGPPSGTPDASPRNPAAEPGSQPQQAAPPSPPPPHTPVPQGTPSGSEAAADASAGKELAEAKPFEFPSHYQKVAPPTETDQYYKNPFALSKYNVHDERDGKGRNAVRRIGKLSLAVALLAMAHIYRIYLSEEGTIVASSNAAYIMRLLPLRVMSRWWGAFTEWEYPVLAQAYAFITGCNMEEAEKGVSEYHSIQGLFTRGLKDFSQARPMADVPLVSPCDAEVRRVGELYSENLVEWIDQVKGYRYEMEEFTRYRPRPVASGKRRVFCVFYLNPGDYHRFHSPVAGWDIATCCQVVGTLLPVSLTAYKYIDELFCLNERVSLNGSWEHGFFSLTAVGAYNVGSVRLAHDKHFRSNVPTQDGLWQTSVATRAHQITNFNEKVRIANKGDEVGHFRCGSTVVVIADVPRDWVQHVTQGSRVQVGQAVFGPGQA